LAISLSDLATSGACQYKNKDYHDFTCPESTEDTDSEFCIFHDRCYLKDDNYEKHTEKIAEKFKERLSKYSSSNMPLKFIGYCLPDISFRFTQFKVLYFNDATFYGAADFTGATFSEQAYFIDARFSKKADFENTTFSEAAFFGGATFYEEADFAYATFSKRTNFFDATFSKQAGFTLAKFSNYVVFDTATFSGVASFGGATFSEEADFENAKFFNRTLFYDATFSKKANFIHAKFSNFADFSHSKFLDEVRFSGTKLFNGETLFNYTVFEEPNEAEFDTNDLSKVSFANSDITKIRFSDKVKWGGNDGYKIIEEEMLENFVKYKRYIFDWENITAPNSKDSDRLKDFLRLRGLNWKVDLQFRKYHNVLSAFGDEIVFAKNQKKVSSVYIRLDEILKEAILSIDGNISYVFIVKEENDKLKIYPHEEVSLESVMAVYRNLRENYEFRLRYDEAGKFFIKEMELKRKYREAPSVSAVFKRKLIKPLNKLKLRDRPEPIVENELKENGWWRRNLFSLTGLYYHLSRYGEDLLIPTLVGIVIVFLSTLFWLTQSKPTLEPHFLINSSSSLYNSTSHFVYLNQAGNSTHWQKAFERAMGDFIPLLSLPSEVKIGLIDYVIKIVGGAVTFGLIAIALRRKFERKYTR
jgi:Pentapeptide repeats (9 copies)